MCYAKILHCESAPLNGTGMILNAINKLKIYHEIFDFVQDCFHIFSHYTVFSTPIYLSIYLYLYIYIIIYIYIYYIYNSIGCLSQ